jgi:glucose-6-phosphate-specific signal transduction histidine kinase
MAARVTTSATSMRPRRNQQRHRGPTNAAKHAQASMAEVCVDTEGQNLHLSIRDDGIGGANAAKGSGITGPRRGAWRHSVHLESPGTGTALHATVPFENS